MKQYQVFLVTGAAGFVGRQVCAQLVASGAEVRAIVRRADSGLARLGVNLWIGDLWNCDLAADAAKKVHVVIHCAGDPRFGNGAHYERANAGLTQHLIDVAREHADPAVRFVYVSTIGAVDRDPVDATFSPLREDSAAHPSSDYGKSKLLGETIVGQSGLSFAIVRPTMVVGEDMRADSHFAVFARQALSGNWFSRIAWPGSLSVIHVDDLAGAIVVTATHSAAANGTFFCAGEPIALSAFFELCAPGKWRVPVRMAAAAIRPAARLIPFQAKALLFPALVATDNRLRELGWQPTRTAVEALAPVIRRERCRQDPDLSPGGQTVITGAASGLGAALAKRLAETRERLLLVDKDAGQLFALSAQLAGSTARVVNLASAAELDALLLSDEWRAHPVTELFACAGIGLRGKVQDAPIDSLRDMFGVNVLARLALGRDAIESMCRRHFGRVVFISSSSAFQPLPYMSVYAASNSALLSLGESWGMEVATEGVHLMTVCPGGMKTNFQKSSSVREVEGEKLMAPEAVAIEIMDGLRRQESTLIVSFRSLAMSLLARLLPRRLSVALWGHLMEKMR